MKVDVHFWLAPNGWGSDADYVQPMDSSLIPIVGDSVTYDHGGESVFRKVVSRHLTLCSNGEISEVTLGVAEMSAEEARLRVYKL